MTQDSTQETLAHIRRVQQILNDVSGRLIERARVHDQSKLESPEKEGFDEVTNVLKGITYGSPEYKAQLEKLKPILAHHYAVNSHHPEHYQKQICIICFMEYPAAYDGRCQQCQNGQFSTEPNVAGMTLLDVLEMFCDWKAATERHADGSIERSIKLNKERFKISDQLASILENTRKEMGW